jgi:hypothetical protein
MLILEHFILIYIHERTLHRHQFGFRQKSSCMHAVYTLCEIIEDVREKKSNAYAVFLDFSKAFDKVNRTKLMYKLIHHLNPSIWLLLKNYYESLTLYAIDNKGNLSAPFKSKYGVKQGGPASPDLFNDYINKLIIILELSGKTYNLRGLGKGVMVYADDTTLVCEDLNSLKACIRLIEEYCGLFDITINAKKTKCMIFGEIKSIVSPEIVVSGQTLEIVETFKFLGVIVDREGKFNKHTTTRRGAFFTGLNEIEKLGVNKLDVPINMKSLLYTSLVRSKLIYGFECIKLKKETELELSSLESNTLKKVCQLNKRSKSTNLLYAMGVTPLKLYILKRKLFFILQLLVNKATNELITLGVHRTLGDVLDIIGVKDEDLALGRDRYEGIVRSLVVKKLEEIKVTEKGIKDSRIVLSVNYLLRNRSKENSDTLQYLLDPRRCGRG